MQDRVTFRIHVRDFPSSCSMEKSYDLKIGFVESL